MSEREVRLTEINYKGHVIKIGHPVRALPTKKGGRDGFDSLVKGFHGHVAEAADGTKRGKVTGIDVTDPNTGATRTFGPERIIPYLRGVEAKATALKERKKVVSITRAKKTAETTKPAPAKATRATKATRAK
jgi:hypothetical protein